MKHSLTWESGATSTRYGIVNLPLDKSKEEIKSQLKEALKNNEHISSQASNPKEIECLWELGFRAYLEDENNSLQNYLDKSEKYTSIYMEINNPNL